MIDIVIIYFALYSSVLLHEMMHFAFAKMFRVAVVKVKVGSDWPLIKMGNWQISPVIGSSFVETDYDDLAQLSVVKKVLYFMAGILMNLLLTICFFTLYMHTGELLCQIISLLNFMSAVINALPFWRTDMANLIRFSTINEGKDK